MSLPKTGPGRGTSLGTLLSVRARGVRSLRNQMTEKCNPRDVKMYGESWNIRMSSSLEAWWWVLWINFLFFCKDGEEVPQKNHYLQSQMVISWHERVRSLSLSLVFQAPGHPSQVEFFYGMCAALQNAGSLPAVWQCLNFPWSVSEGKVFSYRPNFKNSVTNFILFVETYSWKCWSLCFVFSLRVKYYLICHIFVGLNICKHPQY